MLAPREPANLHDGPVVVKRDRERPNIPKPTKRSAAEDSSHATGVSTRIRRPISIRRPKLVGKSEGGTAMQAKFEARKRASAPHFKPRLTTTSRKPTSQAVPHAASPKSSPLLSTGTAISNPTISIPNNKGRPDEGDDGHNRVKADFEMLSSPPQRLTGRRLSTTQSVASMTLANIWWPIEKDSNRTVPPNVANFLLEKSPKGWTESHILPPLPGQMENQFLSLFSRWICVWNTAVTVLLYPDSNTECWLLLSKVERGSLYKHFALVKLTKREAKNRLPAVLRMESWSVGLPRGSAKDQKGRKKRPAFLQHSQIEKGSTGLDVQSTKVHVS